MKLKVKSTLTKFMVIPICLIVMVMLAAPVHAYTPIYSEAQIAAAAEKGVEWLANQQNADGSWSDTSYNYLIGNTGLALLKLETHATFMGMSPLDPSYAYSDNVQAGLNYLFANSINTTISIQTAGDPDTNGTGIGVGVYTGGTYASPYQTAIALMAICASNEPNEIVTVGPQTGYTYAHVAQEIVDWLAWAQNEGTYVGDPDRGGWRYYPNTGDSDNSVTGYCTIGLAYAEAPAPWGFGAHVTIPGFVFSELEPWVERIQIDSGGSPGGSSYTPSSTATNNAMSGNTLRTGNLLSELAILGYGPGTETATLNVTAAVDYMESVWDANNGDPGWRNLRYQACFTMMKGYQAQGIENLDTGSGPESWYREMADVIIATQNPDGSFTAGGDYGGAVKRTAWALLALEKAAPPALSLTPPFMINQVGTQHTVTATFRRAGEAVENAEIDEPIHSDNTNASGEASFTYTGDGGPGTDIIKATAVLSGLSAQATKIWEEGEIPVEVGGEVYPVNRLAVLAPWLALAAALIIGTALVMRRRRAPS
jgi:hypothetical protein